MDEVMSRPMVTIHPVLGQGTGYQLWTLPAETVVLGFRMGPSGMFEVDVDVPAPDVSGIIGKVFA